MCAHAPLLLTHRLHPDLIPYEELTEETKEYDRNLAIQALKMVTTLGYRIKRPPGRRINPYSLWSFGVKADRPGATYQPLAYPTSQVKLNAEALELIDKLGRNTHDVRRNACGPALLAHAAVPLVGILLCHCHTLLVSPHHHQGWAEKRLSQGWTWGPRTDDTNLRHHCLVPFDFLTEGEKNMERAGVSEAVKIIVGLGYVTQKRETAFVFASIQQCHGGLTL